MKKKRSGTLFYKRGKEEETEENSTHTDTKEKTKGRDIRLGPFEGYK